MPRIFVGTSVRIQWKTILFVGGLILLALGAVEKRCASIAARAVTVAKNVSTPS